MLHGMLKDSRKHAAAVLRLAALRMIRKALPLRATPGLAMLARTLTTRQTPGAKE
jgi:hypothetical protein